MLHIQRTSIRPAFSIETNESIDCLQGPMSRIFYCMHSSLSETAHRPWPILESRWTWRQSWSDLLFAHWPVSVELLREQIPQALEIDTFDGTAWIAVVPFRMRDVMLRGLPAMPAVSAFEEMNVRTYVTIDGKPGVWFFSLDAASRMAVWAARTLFHLPYFHADMELKTNGENVHYQSQRHSEGGESFRGKYQPEGSVYTAQPGSLEHWLTERYCLYCETPDGTIKRGHVHHRQWQLQKAAAEISTNTLLHPFQIAESAPPHLLHFSRNIDVIIWPLEEVVP